MSWQLTRDLHKALERPPDVKRANNPAKFNRTLKHMSSQAHELTTTTTLPFTSSSVTNPKYKEKLAKKHRDRKKRQVNIQPDSHSCACIHQPVTYEEDRKKRSFRMLEKQSLELVCSSTLGGSSQSSISSTTPCSALTKKYKNKREIISPGQEQGRLGNNAFLFHFFLHAKPN